VIASWLAREAARTAESAPPFPVPFLTSLAPMQLPVGENVITARPGEFSEEMWARWTAACGRSGSSIGEADEPGFWNGSGTF
jgi:hypothetical protein